MEYFLRRVLRCSEKLRDQGEEARARRLERYLQEIDRALGEPIEQPTSAARS